MSSSTAQVTPKDPKVVLIFSSPRTASNLLMRMLLSRQTNVTVTEYHFSIGVIEQKNRIEKSSLREMSEGERDEILAKYAESVEALSDTVAAARRDGKTLFNKEHCIFLLDPYHYSDSMHGSQSGAIPKQHKNPTVLPDSLLKTFTPIFLIRHPALTMTSYARVAGRWNRGISSDVRLQWCKDLYLWYMEHETSDSCAPIVLEADDILTSPGTSYKIAEMTGLNPDQLVFSWDMDGEEEKKTWHPVKVKMTKTLAGSTGVVTEGKLGSEIDLEEVIQGWKDEFKGFGEDVPADMEAMLRKEMVIYEFLRQRRLQV